MRALAQTLDVLAIHGLRTALIGASAMAVRGVARATMDVDLLLVGPDIALLPKDCRDLWRSIAAGA